MKTVEIYTDGACSGNPGPGGWGAVLRYNGAEKEISGGEAMTTNNRMELTAVIQALLCLKEKYLEQIEGFYKNGLIEREEYKILRAKYEKLDLPEDYH